MKITILMVTSYILYCIRIATKPCKYFQLNAPFFDSNQGIFSKLQIDQLIADKWRLAQRIDHDDYRPQRYPVFVKPEWGQNARGVHRADNLAQLQRLRQHLKPPPGVTGSAPARRYLIQQGTDELNEYEIFSIRHHRIPKHYAVLSITQVENTAERYPVNSIYNADTRYVDITTAFDAEQLRQIWQMLRSIGNFGISRVSVRADSVAALVRGQFHIIEINLFAPMPLNLLDRRYTPPRIVKTVFDYMRRLALATKHRDKTLAEQPVFIKSMLYHRQNTLLTFIRARLCKK